MSKIKKANGVVNYKMKKEITPRSSEVLWCTCGGLVTAEQPPPAHPNTLLQEGRAQWELFQADPRIVPSPTSTFCPPTPLPNLNRAPKADVGHQSPTATQWWSPTSPLERRIFANRLVNEQNKITRKKSILNYGAVGFILILSILFNKKGKYKTHRINNEMQID